MDVETSTDSDSDDAVAPIWAQPARITMMDLVEAFARYAADRDRLKAAQAALPNGKHPNRKGGKA